MGPQKYKRAEAFGKCSLFGDNVYPAFAEDHTMVIAAVAKAAEEMKRQDVENVRPYQHHDCNVLDLEPGSCQNRKFK